MTSTQENDYNNFMLNTIKPSTSSQMLEFMSHQAQELIASIKWPILHQYESYIHESVFRCSIWSLCLVVIIDDKNETLYYYRFGEELYEEFYSYYGDVYLMKYEHMGKQAQAIVDKLRPTGQITFHFERYDWGSCDNDGPTEHMWTLYVFVRSESTDQITKHKYYREVFERQGDKDEEEIYEKTEYNEEDDRFLKPILQKIC